MTLGAAALVCGYGALAHAQAVATSTPAATPVPGTSTQDNRMVLADNESYLVPLEDQKNAHPSYPPNLLGLNLPPRTVCLLVASDDKGAAMLVAKAPTSETCPKGAEPGVRGSVPPDCTSMESGAAQSAPSTLRTNSPKPSSPIMRYMGEFACTLQDGKSYKPDSWRIEIGCQPGDKLANVAYDKARIIAGLVLQGQEKLDSDPSFPGAGFDPPYAGCD